MSDVLKAGLYRSCFSISLYHLIFIMSSSNQDLQPCDYYIISKLCLIFWHMFLCYCFLTVVNGTDCMMFFVCHIDIRALWFSLIIFDLHVLIYMLIICTGTLYMYTYQMIFVMHCQANIQNISINMYIKSAYFDENCDMSTWFF